MLLIGKLRKLTISKAMFNSYFDITRGYVGLKCCWKNPRLRRPLLSPAWETSPCSAPNRACPFGSSAKVKVRPSCPAMSSTQNRFTTVSWHDFSWIFMDINHFCVSFCSWPYWYSLHCWKYGVQLVVVCLLGCLCFLPSWIVVDRKICPQAVERVRFFMLSTLLAMHI